jgi:hypothetical protein
VSACGFLIYTTLSKANVSPTLFHIIAFVLVLLTAVAGKLSVIASGKRNKFGG